MRKAGDGAAEIKPLIGAQVPPTTRQSEGTGTVKTSPQGCEKRIMAGIRRKARDRERNPWKY